jgi:hypothetical protein
VVEYGKCSRSRTTTASLHPGTVPELPLSLKFGSRAQRQLNGCYSLLREVPAAGSAATGGSSIAGGSLHSLPSISI